MRAGAGGLSDLFADMPEADLISLSQSRSGSSSVRAFEDRPVLAQFTRAMEPNRDRGGFVPRYGIKTLVRGAAPFRCVANHSPKIRRNALGRVVWVNGAGMPVPDGVIGHEPKSLAEAEQGTSLAQINHSAIRSMDSVLVQVARGNANFADDAADVRFWSLQDVNEVEDLVAAAWVPRAAAQVEAWRADPELDALHRAAVDWHNAKIAALKDIPAFASLRARIETAHAKAWEAPAD
ncbi:MAG: hypothetical protein AAF914_14380 [Pseudomonadota bacterium]